MTYKKSGLIRALNSKKWIKIFYIHACTNNFVVDYIIYIYIYICVCVCVCV